MSYTTRFDAVEAISSLYDEVGLEISRSLMRRGWPAARAEDVVNESFAAVLGLDDERLVSIDNMRAYLHAVSRNIASKSATAPLRDAAGLDDALDLGSIDPAFAEVDLVASRTLATRAFSSLDAEAQQILWLAVVEGRPMKEIADELGKRVTAVTTQLSRARGRLREAYVREFLDSAPASCDYDMTKLARVISGTASQRIQRDYATHAAACDECRTLETAARDEMKWGSTLILVVAIGAAGSGWLDSRAAHAGVAAAGHGSGSGATASGSKGMMAAVGGMTTGAVLIAVATIMFFLAGGTAPRKVELLEEAPPGDTLMLTAVPATADIPMPSPGGEKAWESTVSNLGSTAAHVFFSVTSITHTAHDQDASLSFSIARDGGEVMAGIPVHDLVGQLISLGPIDAATSVTVRATATRDPSDTDPSAELTLTTAFVATTDVPAGVEVGDLVLPESVPGGGPLPATGGEIPLASAGAAIALISVGALLILQRRSRRPVGVRRP